MYCFHSDHYVLFGKSKIKKNAFQCKAGGCMSLKKGEGYNSVVNQGYSCTFKQVERVTWVSSHVCLVTVSMQVTPT